MLPNARLNLLLITMSYWLSIASVVQADDKTPVVMPPATISATTKDAPKAATSQSIKPVKSAPANIAFLEYLGAMEGDQENWTDFAANDANATAKASTPANATPVNVMPIKKPSTSVPKIGAKPDASVKADAGSIAENGK